MAALTKDRATPYRDGIEIEFPVAANNKIYSGSLVCADTDGYAVPAQDSPGLKFLGVALEQVDNTEGASGAKIVRVRCAGVFEFDAASITQAMVGTSMYVTDDHTIDDGGGPSYDIRVGILVKYVSPTKGWVDITK
jgi:hypothetical protein